VADPWLVLGALAIEAADGPAPTAADLRRGVRIYMYACGLLWVLLAMGGLAWPR